MRSPAYCFLAEIHVAAARSAAIAGGSADHGGVARLLQLEFVVSGWISGRRGWIA